MSDTISTVPVGRVARSLARIADNDDGFKPEVAETIEADLRRLIADNHPGHDPEALDPGAARALQDEWLDRLAEAIS